MHRISEIEFRNIDKNDEYEEIINLVLNKCYEKENLIDLNMYISIILTTPEEIKKLNKEFRNINEETDVLSFPMFEKDEIKTLKNTIFKNPEVLGDIVISIDKVKEQANEYNHSFERELAYMIVHGFYHIMGEDHIKEQDKIIMREKEECVLNELNIKR